MLISAWNWADAISANASWMTFGLNSQFTSELESEPIVALFKSWIEANLFLYPADTFPNWPSTAMRIEEAKAVRYLLQEFAALKQNWDGLQRFADFR